MKVVLLVAAILALLSGCSIYSHDQTPSSGSYRGTGLYPVSTDISKDLFAMASTIDVVVEIDGVDYQMNGNGVGIWQYGFPILCQASPARYRYKLDWKYLALIIPVSDYKTDPLDGTYAFSFSPLAAVKITPFELLMYGSSVIRRDVVVKSQALSGLTVLEVAIAPPPPGSCSIGNCTGSNFSLVSVPKLPATLQCGEELMFEVSFGSTLTSSGTLVISTDQGFYTIPMSGKIFLFP